MPQTAEATKGKRMNKTVVIAAVVIVVVLLVGVYYAFSGMGGGGATVTVNIPNGTSTNQSSNYSPGTITLVIGVNNTVKFVNQDTAIHTVTETSTSPTFDSMDIAGGSSWTHTFSTAGTFSYHCKYHSWMSGTIIVKAA